MNVNEQNEMLRRCIELGHWEPDDVELEPEIAYDAPYTGHGYSVVDVMARKYVCLRCGFPVIDKGPRYECLVG